MPKSAAVRLSAAGALLCAVALLVSGCAGPGGSAATVAADPGGASGASDSPTSSPVPIEEFVQIDPLAEPLVQAGHLLVAGSEGFAGVDQRTALDMATQKLEADVQTAQLSAAGGPAASQASPPVTSASISADIASLLTAVHAVRLGVVETAVRVVNSETPDADQAVRDELFTAIVAQQAQASATDDTPRQTLELVAKVRATRDAQAAALAAAAAAAAAAEAARQAAASSGSSSSGSGPIYFPLCFHPSPKPYTDPFTGEIKYIGGPDPAPDC
ncbi:hypothetical protein VD659_07945 [Herbiconiux sp. 11R-BC]|uniref:hypothetical protein n=1 Tax=Herbiconiux sp. 11R-BC TaxID=3111637 RepID=UPI003BFE8D36